MGVGDKDVIHIGERDWKIRILIDVSALFHTIIDQDVFSSRIEIMAAASHFMISADKMCIRDRLLPDRSSADLSPHLPRVSAM